MATLFDKLKKNSTIKESTSLEKATILDAPFSVQTLVASINIALGGSLDGGLEPGILQIAGPSKHFKSNMGLVIASAFQKRFPEGFIIFCDSEFGSSKKYFAAAGVDPERVLHVPITNIEDLKFELISQLEGLDRKDEVMILVDSIGNLASKKEVEDAKDQKSVADMTRAKALKSLFRMITPMLVMKAIPLIAINHTYKEMALFPKDIVGGGTGAMYSSNDVWIISRSQEKVGDEIGGYTFKINIEKSRKVKEKSQIPVTVMFDGGIKRESGLMDLAMEMNFLCSPSKGWYSLVDQETGEVQDKKWRKADLNWTWFKCLTDDPKFQEAIKQKFRLSTNALIDDSDEYSVEAVIEDDE